MKRLDSVKIKFVPRNENKEVDTLAKWIVVLAKSDEQVSCPISIAQRRILSSLLPDNLEENNNVEVIDKENDDWR